MDLSKIEYLLAQYKSGEISIDQILENLKSLPYESINGEINIDHHRALRTGFPEVIFAQGKTPRQVVDIFRKLLEKNNQVLATRVSLELYETIKDQIPEAVYQSSARLLYYDRDPDRKRTPGIAVVSAGTSDIPVAEEAAVTAELMGNEVTRLYDIGVAGLHRILDNLTLLQQANVLVVVAGMEGALPSVIGGLVSAPIIALPTSVGYGASFHGLAALLAMVNSCSNGIAVVNIDNGFGAGCMAARINALAYKNQKDNKPALES